MVTFHTILKFIVGHVLAGAAVILGTLSVACGSYLVGLATAPGGIDNPVGVIPEFLTLMFTAGVFAVMVSSASFLVSVLLTWLRTKRRFPAWLPVALVPLVTFVVVLLGFGKSRGLDFAAVVAGLALVYFGIYWAVLVCSSAVLDFLARKFSRRSSACS